MSKGYPCSQKSLAFKTNQMPYRFTLYKWLSLSFEVVLDLNEYITDIFMYKNIGTYMKPNLKEFV